MNGILLVNKEQGFTSFDVIAKLRGILKIRRLGHAGTLDPMATGCLPVFIGKATRACDILPDNEKSYTAEFKLGIITDTQDVTGKVMKIFDKSISEKMLSGVVETFNGEVEQIPPMYSAVSVNGRRLYHLARQGIEVERKSRKIIIDCCKVMSYNEEEMTGKLFISCSKGTYIRTIIHDIGEKLECGAIMTSLVRNSSSGFKLEDCHTLSQISEIVKSDRLIDYVIPIDRAFYHYDGVTLTEIQTGMYKNGVRLDSQRVAVKENTDNKYRVYSFDGKFLGIGQLKPETQEFYVFKNMF